MKIAMIGTGYVGLVSGACFSDFGHDVVCVDKDATKIDALHAGRMPIFEPGLDALVAANVAAGRLSFTTDMAPAVAGADAVFIAVGTPSRRGDGHADLSYVYGVAQELADTLAHDCVIVTKSTVPVGTGDEVERILRTGAPNRRHSVASNPEFLREGAAIGDFKRPDRIVIGAEDPQTEAVLRAVYRPLFLNEAPILITRRRHSVASNPEFLREGAAIGDFKRPDRIVIGAEDPQTEAVLRAVYRPLFLNEAPILITRRRTAEMIKYAANAFLATKITFINEIADLCESVGADVKDVARGIGLDNRIGSKFLHAGPGYGGSCFPKDTLALLKTAQDNDVPLRLVEATVLANDLRKRAMGRKIVQALGGNARDKTVALLGLTFKPNTDDMRDSPSLAIVQTLIDAGAHVTAYDPEGMTAAAELMPQVEMKDSAYAAAQGADAVAIVTEWDAFRALDLARLGGVMNDRLLVDLRNIYRREEVLRHGFRHIAIGSPAE